MLARSAAAGVVAGTVFPFAMYRTLKRDALEGRKRSPINWDRIGRHMVESGLLAIITEEFAHAGKRQGKRRGDKWKGDEWYEGRDDQVH